MICDFVFVKLCFDKVEEKMVSFCSSDFVVGEFALDSEPHREDFEGMMVSVLKSHLKCMIEGRFVFFEEIAESSSKQLKLDFCHRSIKIKIDGFPLIV